jgi:hypothetical protein
MTQIGEMKQRVILGWWSPAQSSHPRDAREKILLRRAVRHHAGMRDDLTN